ncbi:hypothetical protein LSUE1_G006905 [Lachnellula suecica]|uniref:Uncharacterized protein n=1 Tax=Lachnellula suecica TaxID=602035 RepID=A0A8T9CBK7_9HELO|nr:hypothetical protein LSUE1_G006905 [Lachnellula suecica]
MARFFLLFLFAFLATASNPLRHQRRGSALIPFNAFDAGSHSYAIEFQILGEDSYRFYWENDMHVQPVKIFEDIIARCARLGNISTPATRETSQMLVASQYKQHGVDFIYTDYVDYEDPMQACIQNIENPSIQHDFSRIASARADSNPQDGVARTVQIEAAKPEATATKGAGSMKRAGLGLLGVMACIGGFGGGLVF